MNEAMIRNWNDLVRPEDWVYVLGDFSLAFRAVETFSQRLMGNKLLIPGNHDFCHSYHKKSRNEENRKKWIEKYEYYGWKVLPEQYGEHFEGLGSVTMCHHPYFYKDDTYDDKYEKWRPEDHGGLLLNGHVHEKWKTRSSYKGTLQVNVGVDVWDYKPVSLEQIIELVNDGHG
jgi:calcineurin-like phosphoesterase family protein